MSAQNSSYAQKQVCWLVVKQLNQYRLLKGMSFNPVPIFNLESCVNTVDERYYSMN